MPERIRRPLVKAFIAFPPVYPISTALSRGSIILAAVGVLWLAFWVRADWMHLAMESLLLAMVAFLLTVFRDIVVEVGREAPLVVLMNPESYPPQKIRWAIGLVTEPYAKEFYDVFYPGYDTERLISEARERLK